MKLKFTRDDKVVIKEVYDAVCDTMAHVSERYPQVSMTSRYDDGNAHFEVTVETGENEPVDSDGIVLAIRTLYVF